MNIARRPLHTAVLIVVLSILMLGLGAVAWAMPAHPDLVARLGKEEVARLEKSAMPASLAESLVIKGNRAKVTGTGTCLVILWEFSDHPADQGAHPASGYDEMMFSTGVFPTGSMNDYYLETSYGQFQIGGLISGWTTAGNTYASYANADTSQDANTAQEMLRDAIAYLDPTLDFSQFDNDGPDGIPDSGDDDGLVDALFFVHAGPGEEATGDKWDIWSHAWGLWPPVATDDGVEVYRYSVEPEQMSDGSMISIGVFAHEYAHVLGLPDLYDTDYSSAGIGDWGLMSGGSWTHRADETAGSSPAHLTAWSKIQLGWLTPTTLTGPQTGLVIPPSETHPVAYRVFRQGESGGSEYFLLENRRAIGFDAGLTRRQILLDLEQPEGLVIFHVDDDLSGNSNDGHRLVDVVDASPWFHGDGTWHETHDGKSISDRYGYLDNYCRGDNGDVWPGFTAFNADSTEWVGPRDRNTFSDASIPPAQDFDCDPTGVILANIALDGENVTLDVGFAAKGEAHPAVAKALRIWDFEGGSVFPLKYCNSYAHIDKTHGGDCDGDGGLWFGSDTWDCPGYGNNWEDVAWIDAYVNVGNSPQVSLTHRHEVEPGYDYCYLEVRESGNPMSDWIVLDSFTGAADCRYDAYDLPQMLLNDIEVDGVAHVDIRLRLSSDGAWSSQDGEWCGIGWWVDTIMVSSATLTPVDDVPVLVTRLEAPAPNPFNPSTLLKYTVPTGARDISLVVYDQRGRLVRTLGVEPAPGQHEVRWDGRNDAGQRAASGLYFARLTVDGVGRTQKLAMVK